ncbi:MAG: transposase [Thermodesulfobacteriota bacterium]
MAFNNENILPPSDGQVTLRYRYSKAHTSRTATLPAEQLIGRFLQYPLAHGFHKVRPYGLLHPKQRHLMAIVKDKLQPGTSATVEPSPYSATTHTLSTESCSLPSLRLRDDPYP